MRSSPRSRDSRCLWPVLGVLVLWLCSSAGAAVRDDTAALQALLDKGGAIFLPNLPNGECYATRGLWLSRDDTSITSDGACIVALGLGEARIKRGDGTPVHASAVFYVSHSNIRAPLPVRVSIRGLRITVPKAKRMRGVTVFGHEVTLGNLHIDGAPLNDVLVGSGTVGSGGMTGRIAIERSTFLGAQRDAVSVYGPIGLRIDANTLSGARNAGLRITAADRGQPVFDVHVTRNVVTNNRGAGIALDLQPKNGAPVLADGIELSGNMFHGNRGPAVMRRTARPAPQPTSAPTTPPATTTTPRDDTPWLQARLDRGGGTIFLPKLPGDACYATRALWVSHDHTTITSDGACIVSLGLGPVRLHSIDGDPIPSSAVFFVNRSNPKKPAPVDVTISNLRIVVPPGQGLNGVAVYGHRTTLRRLDISGAPKDDVTISGRANGNSYAGQISILDCTLSGAMRNAISATAVIGLQIEGNTIQGVRDSPPGQPAAGIDVEPDDRAQPAFDVRIVNNTIQDNAGPGILLELEPNEGPAVIATSLVISGNTIVRNALKRSPPKRAGIVVAGGQDGGEGTLVLKDNVVRGNGGPGLLTSRMRLVVQASGNDLSGNEAGPSS
jgi:Right handed beta helix region